MMTDRPHKQLQVWARSMDLVTQVYRITREFPSSERFGLATQMQRAAVSVPSNIAEGAARRSRNEYVQYLYTARASLSELDTQLDIAQRLGFVDRDTYERLFSSCNDIGRMLNALIASLSRPRSP